MCWCLCQRFTLEWTVLRIHNNVVVCCQLSSSLLTTAIWTCWLLQRETATASFHTQCHSRLVSLAISLLAKESDVKSIAHEEMHHYSLVDVSWKCLVCIVVFKLFCFCFVIFLLLPSVHCDNGISMSFGKTSPFVSLWVEKGNKLLHILLDLCQKMYLTGIILWNCRRAHEADHGPRFYTPSNQVNGGEVSRFRLWRSSSN